MAPAKRTNWKAEYQRTFSVWAKEADEREIAVVFLDRIRKCRTLKRAKGEVKAYDFAINAYRDMHRSKERPE